MSVDTPHAFTVALHALVDRWRQPVTTPDPIGPLHGAGFIRAQKACADALEYELRGLDRVLFVLTTEIARDADRS